MLRKGRVGALLSARISSAEKRCTLFKSTKAEAMAKGQGGRPKEKGEMRRAKGENEGKPKVEGDGKAEARRGQGGGKAGARRGQGQGWIGQREAEGGGSNGEGEGSRRKVQGLNLHA